MTRPSSSLPRPARQTPTKESDAATSAGKKRDVDRAATKGPNVGRRADSLGWQRWRTQPRTHCAAPRRQKQSPSTASEPRHCRRMTQLHQRADSRRREDKAIWRRAGTRTPTSTRPSRRQTTSLQPVVCWKQRLPRILARACCVVALNVLSWPRSVEAGRGRVGREEVISFAPPPTSRHRGSGSERLIS
jgi:hypothetical protein